VGGKNGHKALGYGTFRELLIIRAGVKLSITILLNNEKLCNDLGRVVRRKVRRPGNRPKAQR